jgi:hypothetical protein
MSKVYSSLLVVLMLSACSSSSGFDLSKYMTVDENASTKVKLRACLVSEANSRFNNGTLFTSGITAAAKDLSNTCIKKLALESTGVSSETESMASTIIQNLKNYGSAQ